MSVDICKCSFHVQEELKPEDAQNLEQMNVIFEKTKLIPRNNTVISATSNETIFTAQEIEGSDEKYLDLLIFDSKGLVLFKN